MAKQTINLGTSANKGDGDPLRTAFDKVNDNFDELYVDLKQVKSAQTGGGTLIVDTIGSVHATDSTLLVDGNNSKITGPLASTTWDVTDNNIEITTTNTGVNANITIEAQGLVTLQESAAEDYVQVSQNGVVLYSNSDIALRTSGQDIHIGYDTQSGNVEMGHNSSFVNINGTLNVNAFSKLVPPSYTTAGRAGFTTEGFMVVNTTLGHLEAYVNGAWRKMTLTDVGELTDTGGVIPTDLSDITDTTNLIKTDVSQLADATNLIATNIGDLLPGGNLSDVLTRSATGYAWTAPNYFGGDFADLGTTPTTLAGYGITDAVALTGLSVSTASAGSAALAYNNSTGAFTFTPPDLSSYLTSYTETDPVVGAITGIVKADGAGNISAAVAGTDYLASVAFSDLTSTPTTIAGYGITDAVEDFADLGTTPTTIAGYGITDAFDGDYNSLSNQPTIPSAYTDSDVDTHLNQSNPTDGYVLSWTSGDYSWVEQSGGGASSRSTATGTTGSLADAAQADLDITGFKSYMVATITTDRAARVRLYTTAAARTADASRAEGVDPTSDAGVIAEVITTGAETVTISPGALGFNLESPPTTNIPCRVTNKSGGASTVQVSLHVLQLEA